MKNGAELIADIAGDAPGICYPCGPLAGELPSADIKKRIASDHFYAAGNLRVALLFIQPQFLPAAPVDLYKIIPPRFQHQLQVLFIMPVQPRSHANGILIPHGGTGIDARIGIDPGFKPFTMYVIRQRFHPRREARRVSQQLTLAVPSAKKAIIYIDKIITGRFKRRRRHYVGLRFNDLLTDCHVEIIPAGPAHNGRCRMRGITLLGGKRRRQELQH